MVAHLACGKVTECPFPNEVIQRAKGLHDTWCHDCGVYSSRGEVEDLQQVVDVRRLQMFLRTCGDPDEAALDTYAMGVKVGADVQLPRTPAIYLEKQKWRLPELPEDEANWGEVVRDNYVSASDNLDQLRKEIMEELQACRMVKMTLAEARKEFGEKLSVASLALIQEGPDKWRLIHDGTHGVLVNNRIRPLDRADSPTVMDISATNEDMAEWSQESGVSLFTLVWDFSKAHRLVPVRREDWGFLACSLNPKGSDVTDDTDIYLNTCGTYGVGSASYWWGRLASMATRPQHYMLGFLRAAWILLYADDGKITAEAKEFLTSIPLALLTLLIFNFPAKWAKCHGGTEYQWVGYWEDVKNFSLGISASRRNWVIKWITEILEKGGISVAEFRSGLGRLSFVCGAITYDRPFLGPLYTWVSACSSGTFREIPVFIKFILTWIKTRLLERHVVICDRGRARTTPPLELFRSDAKAEGDLIRIGGWQVMSAEGNHLSTMQAPWFSISLDRFNAPWAYRRGEPFRTIASLELFGSLISAILFLPTAPKGVSTRAKVSVAASTDNKGVTYAVTKLMTTKFPLLAFVAELAVQMERGGWDLDLEWVPRDQNAEADALTNDIFSDFTEGNRIEVHLDKLPFVVLQNLLNLGEGFYEEQDRCRDAARLRKAEEEQKGEAKATLGPKGGAKAPFRKKPPGLKTTQPW